MIIVLVWLLFLQNISLASWRGIPEFQEFWLETRDLIRFSLLFVDVVKHAQQVNDSTSTSGLEGLVISLKEALPQPWLVVRRIFL